MQTKAACCGKTTAMTISAILFDFDGTLVESLDVKIVAFASLYRRYGEDIERAAVQHYRAHSGVSRLKRIRHCHEQILGETPSDAEISELGDTFGTMVEDKVVASQWVPGAREFLDAHVGVLPLFIASATPQEELERIVEKRGMGRYFEAVFGSPPDKTEIIRAIIGTHRLEPAGVIMIGDGRADYDAAVANEVRFVGRLPGGHPNPFPDTADVIDDLTDLPRFIRK
jgi:phosphoglycolate phosphatase-like HAD superfamily hydrolase